MTESSGERLRELFEDLAKTSSGSPDETVGICRVDQVAFPDRAAFERVRDLARVAKEEGLGRLEVFTVVSGEVDLGTVGFEDVERARISVVLSKARTDAWVYFLTEKGFRDALGEALVAAPVSVWVATRFEPFASMTLSVSPWGGPRVPPTTDVQPERPRKYVRDLTHRRTPGTLGPWLPRKRPAKGSEAYSAWCGAACERLAYALPSEVWDVEGETKVVLRGPRSTPVAVVPNGAGWAEDVVGPLGEAVSWVFAEEPRTAETRFLFLNNQLSLGWRDGLFWPDGLLHVLQEAVVNAREAYAFHLQGESKDALKALGDLRKGLQEEVAKAQAATRDLLAALWRDFAVAGLVMALRTPVGRQVADQAILRFLPPATGMILIMSLVVTVASNARFAQLADKGREDWRRKLYSFVQSDEWDKLVSDPIRKTRSVYRLTLPFVAVLYGVAAWYLLTVTEPSILAASSPTP